MTMTDPIADMFTRIRNANSVHHDKVEIPCSKIKTAIAEILKSEGFIKDFEVVPGQHQNVIRVQLKYGPKQGKSYFRHQTYLQTRFESLYAKDQLPSRTLGGLGIAAISTSKGMMTDKAARKAGLGGEVVAYVW